MQKRFVVIPAVPIEKDSFRVGARFFSNTVSGGYDLYDNLKKLRIKLGHQRREVAEMDCARHNEGAHHTEEHVYPSLETA